MELVWTYVNSIDTKKWRSHKNLQINFQKLIFKIDRGHKVNGTVNAVSVVKALNEIKNFDVC